MVELSIQSNKDTEDEDASLDKSDAVVKEYNRSDDYQSITEDKIDSNSNLDKDVSQEVTEEQDLNNSDLDSPNLVNNTKLRNESDNLSNVSDDELKSEDEFEVRSDNSNHRRYFDENSKFKRVNYTRTTKFQTQTEELNLSTKDSDEQEENKKKYRATNFISIFMGVTSFFTMVAIYLSGLSLTYYPRETVFRLSTLICILPLLVFFIMYEKREVQGTSTERQPLLN